MPWEYPVRQSRLAPLLYVLVEETDVGRVNNNLLIIIALCDTKETNGRI